MPPDLGARNGQVLVDAADLDTVLVDAPGIGIGIAG
jgi:hypothetical protein